MVTLFQDSSAEAAANVWSTLRANDIKYEMKTITNHTAFGRSRHYSNAMKLGMGGMGGNAYGGDGMQYVYVIKVKRKDLERAKEVCGL